MDGTTKLEVTDKDLALLILAVSSVLDSAQRHVLEAEDGTAHEDLLRLMEIQMDFAEVWVKLQAATGVPQSAIRRFLAGTE